MAAAVKRRKGARTQSAKGDTYHVIGPHGNELKGKEKFSSSGMAVSFAQTRAMSDAVPDENEPMSVYWIERRSLFGPAVVLYKLERRATGELFTFTVSTDD